MRFGHKLLISFIIIGVIPIIALALLFYDLNTHFLVENKLQHLWSSLSSVDAFLNQEKSSLDTTLQDYTVWSDHYQALLVGNTSWIEENIISWVPEHFDMDLVVLWDRAGKKVASQGDLESFDPEMQNLILKGALEDRQFLTGFERLGSSLAIFSAGPVLPNDKEGSPAGALLFVRTLKPEGFSLFESENSFPFLIVGGELQVSRDRASTPEIEELRGKIQSLSAQSFSLLLSSGAMTVSKAILNPQGKTLGYLGLLDLAQEIKETKQNTLIFSLIVGVGFLGLVLLLSGFLHRWLLVPLNTLSQDVQDLYAGKKKEERKWPKDQIGQLARSLIGLYRSSQEALQKAKNERIRFRGILDSSQDVILVFDSQGHFQDANLAAEKFFSASKKELLGMKPEEALKKLNIDPQTLSPRFWEGFREAFSLGKETVYEGFFQALNREVIVSFLPLFLEKELKGVVLSIKDITPLRKLELERRTLLEGVAHDLGSPITSLMAAVELLKRSDAPLREMGYLQSMENNLFLLKTLVQNLLNLNRLDAGAIRLDKVPLRLCPFM
ncbi:MAG: CHASE4 domain-containing protein, partial [bacterium]